MEKNAFVAGASLEWQNVGWRKRSEQTTIMIKENILKHAREMGDVLLASLLLELGSIGDLE